MASDKAHFHQLISQLTAEYDRVREENRQLKEATRDLAPPTASNPVAKQVSGGAALVIKRNSSSPRPVVVSPLHSANWKFFSRSVGGHVSHVSSDGPAPLSNIRHSFLLGSPSPRNSGLSSHSFDGSIDDYGEGGSIRRISQNSATRVGSQEASPYFFAQRRSRGFFSTLFRGKSGSSNRSSRSLRTSGISQVENPWVINPEQSRFLQRWDVLTMAALGFVAICVPVHVAMVDTKFDAFFLLSCLIDTIFLLDMVLQFFLMYPRRTNYGYALEHNHRAIVKHYLKTWFLIDFISILPVDVVGLLTKNEEVQQMKAVKIIRLLRLLKLARLARAARLMRRFEARASIPYGKLAILKFFGILLIITHWLANLWALTLMLVDENEGVPRWIDALTFREENVTNKTKDTAWKLYVACLYFTSYTITSVGYGDIGPKNIIETIVATVMIIVSGISWAVVLGQVSGIVSNLGSEEQEFRSRMDELNSMMEDRVMDPTMRQRLRTFFLSNRSARRRNRQRQIISEMSSGLQGEVVLELNRMWIAKVSMLNQMLEKASVDIVSAPQYRSVIVEVAMKLQLVVHAQSEVFGEPYKLNILILGLVARQHRVYTSGSVWGIDFVLADSKYAEPCESFALTYCELTTLKRKTFFDVIKKHATVLPKLQYEVRYHCRWLSFQRAILAEAKERANRLAFFGDWEESRSLSQPDAQAKTGLERTLSGTIDEVETGCVTMSETLSRDAFETGELKGI